MRLKSFTPGHWEIFQADPVTGEVVFHHGGSYRLVEDELEQTVEFAGRSTANNVGQVRKFKVTVEGDTYTQIGLGNPFSEIWVRADARTIPASSKGQR